MWEAEVIPQMGLRITKDELADLPKLIESVVENTQYIDNIQKLKADTFYNFGTSRSIIADQIQQLLGHEEGVAHAR